MTFGNQRHTVPQEVANELTCRASRITQLMAENAVLRKALGDDKADKALAPTRPAAPPVSTQPKAVAPTQVKQESPPIQQVKAPVARTGPHSPFRGAPKRT